MFSQGTNNIFDPTGHLRCEMKGFLENRLCKLRVMMFNTSIARAEMCLMSS